MDFDTLTTKPQGKPAANTWDMNHWDATTGKQKPPATPAPSGQRELTGHDIASLRPKEFRNLNLGLELYAPGDWREVKNDRSLHLRDPATGARLEASGFARDDISIEKWVAMRLPMLEKEMPHMAQVARPAVVKSENWGRHVQGIVAEYKGSLPGDEEDTHLLVCCLRTDNMLISITVSAKASVFEKQRAVYGWIFSRTDISATPLAVSGSVASKTAGGSGNGGGGGGGGYNAPVRGGQFNGGGSSDDDVGRIAIGQRLIILSILLTFGLSGMIKNTDYSNHTELVILFFMCMMTMLMSVVGYFRLTGGLGWSGLGKLFGAILSFVPFANLVLLVIVNRKASARIRAEGHTVGFFGGGSAIPSSNHDLRNIAVISLLLAFGLSAVGSFVPSKKEEPITEFSPPDHSFSISMPGTPQEAPAKSSPGVSNVHRYTLSAGKLRYEVTYFDLPVRPADSSSMLDGIRDSVTSDGKIKLIEQNHIQHDGYAGRNLLMSSGSTVTQANLFIIGKTVYLIGVDAPEREQYSPKIAAYLESFHVNQ